MKPLFKTRPAFWLLLGIALLLAPPSPAWGGKTLHVGVPIDFPPFSFKTEGQDRVRGYSVDLVHNIGKTMDTKVNFLAGDVQGLLRALKNKQLDLVCGVVLTDQIKDEFDYLEISVFVKRFFYVNRNQPDIPGQKEPPWKSVAVVWGQPWRDLGFDPDKMSIIHVKNTLDALNLLNENKVQVFIGPSERVVNYLTEKHDLKDIHQVGVTVGQFPLTMLVQKGDTALLKKLSLGLGKAISNGSVGKVQDKWLGGKRLTYFWDRYHVPILIMASLFLLSLVVVTAWNQALKRKVARITNDLRVSEERYRTVIESSPEMVFLVNKLGGISMVNQGAQEKLAIGEVGKGLANFYHFIQPGQNDKASKFLVSLFQDGYASAELILCDRSGKPLDAEVVAACIKRGGEGERLACCFARDITKRKRMEEELVQSERLAIIGKMSASVAHEINNPIGIVLAHAEDLISGELERDEAKESLKAIRRNAMRAGQITEDLLVQATSAPPANAVLDLAETLEECLFFIKPRLKKISLTKNLRPRRYFVLGDERRLQQMFINLLLNSVDSIESKGEIRVSLGDEWDGGKRFVRAVVEDTGKGIPADELDLIFDPFFSRGKENGFGLGLFIARRIAEKHHGVIIPKPGQLAGTSMVVRFPAASPKS